MDRVALSPIALAEMEIRRDREDLDRLKRRYPGYDFLLVGNGAAPSSIPTPTLKSQRPLSGLEQAIFDVMSLARTEEWTSRRIVTTLNENQAFHLSENDDAAMNAVALALVSLRELGRIQRVHEGKGRDPHRYKLASTEKEVPSEEKTS
jgi:hypothetical protein